MRRVLFTKFSSQRKKEFQIATSIIQDCERKYVVKRALCKEGQQHLLNMQKYYGPLCELFKNMHWDIISGEINSDGELEFPFISGDGLDKLIQENIEKQDYKEAEKIIVLFVENIMSNSHLRVFTNNENFKEMFGDVEFGKYELHAFEISNVDLVFSNFIFNNGMYTMIDYEWVFPFQIPVEFVLYRSLFHSVAFQQLPIEYQNVIYERLRIDDYLKNLFDDMEQSFQKYTKGIYTDLNAIRENIDNKVYYLANNKNTINKYKIYIGDECLLTGETLQSDISLQFGIKDRAGNIKLILNNSNGIYKIKSITALKGGNEECIQSFRHNACLQIENDYYFTEDIPTIEIENNQYDVLRINYSILVKDDTLLFNLTDSLLKENRAIQDAEIMKQQSTHYKELYELSVNDAERWQKAYTDCGKILKDTQEAFATCQNELNEIHQKLWWKIYNKLRKGH